MDPSLTPALEPPPGLAPNFVNPPTQLPAVIAGSAFVLAIVTISVFLRVFTKVYIVRKFYLEDCEPGNLYDHLLLTFVLDLSVLAWALLVVFTALVIHLGKCGFARHQWDVNLVMLPRILYVQYLPSCVVTYL